MNTAAAVVKDSGLKGDRSVSIRLAAPTETGFSAQALVHKWVKNDIFEYVVILKVFNPATQSYDGFQPELSVVVPQKSGVYSRATFTGLSQGAKYRTYVVAKGNNGGTAASLVLNSNTEAFAEYDFTADQDVEDTLTGSAQIVFDVVDFNGSATTVITGPNDGAYRNPTDRPTASAIKDPVVVTTNIQFGAWGWDIVSTRVSNLDMSPILCSDGDYHTPNSFVAYPLNGSLDTSTIHASYPNWFDAATGTGNFQWWMYAGQWQAYGVTQVGVKAVYNDGNGVTGQGDLQATGTF
jgi:hypothetical protein